MTLAISSISRYPTIRRRRLFFDRLEDRALLATFTVANTNDSGAGSLRQAILDANADPAADVIDFGISGTISPITALPSIFSPVEIDGAGQQVELNGSTLSAATGLDFSGGAGSSVRGLTISHFFFGVAVRGPATGTVIEGNNISTNTIGVGLLLSASNTVIDGNAISLNSVAGIAVGAQSTVANGQEVTGTQIVGNYIGTNSNGDDLGNGAGILINAAEGTQIGGTGAGLGNVIAYNTGAGVSIGTVSTGGQVAKGNTIRGNSIYDNGGLGIDLSKTSANGQVQENDAGDADLGTNGLQNFPELWSASGGASTQVVGYLNSTPDTSFQIDFYANSLSARQGKRFLGTASVTTTNYGKLIFDVPVGATAIGEFITATATDTIGNTSEFSASIEVTVPSNVPLTMVYEGSLVIVGTAGNEEIAVTRAEEVVPGQRDFQVSLNGIDLGLFSTSKDALVYLRGGSDSVTINGATSNFELEALHIFGTSLADTVTLNSTAENVFYAFLYAGAGDDVVTVNSHGWSSPDIHGEDGNDTFYITSDNVSYQGPSVLGDAGDDVFEVVASVESNVGVSGKLGNDRFELDISGAALVGAEGGDLIGASDQDNFTVDAREDSAFSILGSDGADSIAILSVGAGLTPWNEPGIAGRVRTGAGDDSVTLAFGSLAGLVSVNNTDFNAEGVRDALFINSPASDDTITKTSGQITYGDPVTETVIYDGSFLVTINGGDGNDTIFDPGENTTILGGPGNDTIIIDATTGTGVILDGGPGSDHYIIGGGAIGDLAGPVAIADTGTTGVDTVTVLGTNGDDSIDQTSTGFTLNDTTISVAGLEWGAIDGAGGDDEVIATGTPPVPVQVHGVTDLIVVGTGDNDQISFDPTSVAGEVVARLNGQIVSRVVGAAKIVAYGGAGDDNIRVAGSISLPVWLYGQAGNDRLNAGAGGSLLIGGDGNDELLGGDGRDIMVGGQGADRLIGNANDDILIASLTKQDDPNQPDHEAFWNTVLAQWSSSDGFEMRVNNLKSKLLPEVVDDYFADQIDFLNGAAGSDWLIFMAGEDKVAGQAEASN